MVGGGEALHTLATIMRVGGFLCDEELGRAQADEELGRAQADEGVFEAEVFEHATYCISVSVERDRYDVFGCPQRFVKLLSNVQWHSHNHGGAESPSNSQLVGKAA